VTIPKRLLSRRLSQSGRVRRWQPTSAIAYAAASRKRMARVVPDPRRGVMMDLIAPISRCSAFITAVSSPGKGLTRRCGRRGTRRPRLRRADL
jgi:hypothetical protein